MKATVQWVDEAASTNALIAPDAPEGLFVVARTQTAGRGQRGNSWEAEPGKNLTFSLCLRPRQFPVVRQFELSMLIAVACCDFLRTLVITPEWLRLKWPNDIYFGDHKLGGILIEQSVCDGMIERCVAGIGINVNQTIFRSDAPNPISLIHAIGHELKLEPLMAQLAQHITDVYEAYCSSPDCEALIDEYKERLWRNEGAFMFKDTLSDTVFEAEFYDVMPDGHILLTDSSDNIRSYTFKEIEWL